MQAKFIHFRGKKHFFIQRRLFLKLCKEGQSDYFVSNDGKNAARSVFMKKRRSWSTWERVREYESMSYRERTVSQCRERVCEGAGDQVRKEREKVSILRAIMPVNEKWAGIWWIFGLLKNRRSKAQLYLRFNRNIWANLHVRLKHDFALNTYTDDRF